MNRRRKIAIVAGAFFILTEISAIAARFLYDPALSRSNYVTGPDADTRVSLGAFSEIILMVAVVGTAVTLFPIVKRQNESIALGYVGGRLFEAAVIAVGTIAILSVVTLRQDSAGVDGTDPTALVTAGKSLAAIHDWTFLLGPNFALGVNTLMLAYLMYRSALVPRFIALLGLVGGPLICASATAVMFGLYEQLSTWGAVAALPVFAWEVTLAVWLIGKGFNPPSPVADAATPSGMGGYRD